MSPLKAISLGAAAYLFLNEGDSGSSSNSFKKQIEDLTNRLSDAADQAAAKYKEYEERIDELTAQVITAQDDAQNIINQYEGDLKNRVQVYVSAKVSRISFWFDYWNSEFRMTVKNISPVNITLGGVRLYWTVNGQKSILTPWTTSSYVIQPGNTVTVVLYGFQNENHFANVPEIQAIEKLFKDSGENKSSKTYKLEMPMLCEADFVLLQNGEKFKYALKDIPGTLVGYTDGRVFDPHKSRAEQEKAKKSFDEIQYHK